jgi:outer membrane biosynthesis protein TonB
MRKLIFTIIATGLIAGCGSAASTNPSTTTASQVGQTQTQAVAQAQTQAQAQAPKPKHQPHKPDPKVTPKPHKPTPPLVAGLVVSSASASVEQAQPRPGSCHVRASGLMLLPDPRCTPGAVNPAVTQATIGQTICVSGWTRTVRPSSAVTAAEKLDSEAAYGDDGSGAYEYDHLIPLELGGAVNDARNLWPEPGRIPNPKDSVENDLRALVCSGEMPLRTAQVRVAHDWVSLYQAPAPKSQPAPKPKARPAPAPVSSPSAPSGATGLCEDGTFTYAIHRQGACSHHGGVKEWL